jgi:hypothetical protein
MDAVGAGRLGGGEDAVDAQVAVGCRAGADLYLLVGGAREGRGAIGFGDDGNRLDAEPASGANDAEGDLAAIGDQDF